MHTEPRATIEVFADVWCPFTHVGLREVAAMRQRLGRSDLVIRVRAWPLELVNGTGLDPIATRSHVEHLREQVEILPFGMGRGHGPICSRTSRESIPRGYKNRGKRRSPSCCRSAP